MAGRQKKQAPRNIEKATVIRRAQEYFQFRLACVDNLPELRKLAQSGPAKGESGGEYYSNLSTFVVSEFTKVPSQLATFEKQLYLDLIDRLEAAGQLKDGVKVAIVSALNCVSSKPLGRTMAARVAGKK
jgi:hypothetical protein